MTRTTRSSMLAGSSASTSSTSQASASAKRSKTKLTRSNEVESDLDQDDIPPTVAAVVGVSVAELNKIDRLSQLSPELISLILFQLAGTGSEEYLSNLFRFSLVSKSLLPHIRIELYRHLTITTRTNAHAIHRTLHGNELNKLVKHITADVGTMAKTSSQWVGWFLFHSMHSLCGIIGSCRSLLTLTLFLPSDASAWTQSLCSSLVDLKYLNTLTKDLDPSGSITPGTAGTGLNGAGKREGMDVGWKPRRNFSMWSVSTFIKPLASLKSLHTLRLCGISSDSSTSPPQSPHTCRLTEVVLIEVNITNTDLLHLLGSAQSLKKLTLWRSSLLSKRGLTHVLKKCINLVEIRIGGSWFGAKDEDDTNFPLDNALPSLPHLRLIHISGSLISPSILLLPSTNLNHLQVSNCPSFNPTTIHAALCKMRNDPPPVRKLTLGDMSRGTSSSSATGGVGGGTGGEWTESWKFTVRATAEAKGVTLDGGEGGGEDVSDSE